MNDKKIIFWAELHLLLNILFVCKLVVYVISRSIV